MRLYKRVSYSFGIALFVFFSSMFIGMIPCRIAPNIPSPSYSWSFCDLNPDSAKINLVEEYFGYSTKLSHAYLLTIILVFLISMLILHFTARSKKD